MTTAVQDIREMSAACLAQPGLAVLLRMLLGLLEQQSGTADLDQIFAHLDPGAYADPVLCDSVASYLTNANRPDLARRWSRAAGLLRGEPDTSVQPTLRPLDAKSLGGRAQQQQMPPRGERDADEHDDDSDEDDVVDLSAARKAANGGQPVRERVGFADVAGLEDVKAQIRRRIIQPFEAKGLYAKFRKKSGGGVLMYGPPGCGKTLLARATAEECKATFMPIEISEILSRYVGDSEKRMKAIFDNARRQAPAILFFDEVEALAQKRSSGMNNVDSMVSVFLSEFDGLAGNNEGVLVLAATNVPWSVDSAFRRPGRFDRTLFVPPPDKEARQAILRGQLAKLPHMPDLNLETILARTSGYSGADLAALVSTAADFAIDESMDKDRVVPVSNQHLKEAMSEVRATTLEWLTTARSYAEYANRDGAWDDLAEFLRKHG